MRISQTEAQTRYAAFLDSERWTAQRDRVLERDGRRCRVCNSGLDLNVHHRLYRVPWRPDRDGDLLTLCRRCHALFHGITRWTPAIVAFGLGLIAGVAAALRL